MSDPSKLISTTDFPREFPIRMFQGDFDTSDVTIIDHGLPFTPFNYGYVSRTSDFAVKIPLGANYFWGTSYSESILPLLRSNDSRILLFDLVAAGVTLYYRLFCTTPPGWTGILDANVTNGQALQDTTDYNFAKLVGGDSLTLQNNSSVSIDHDYGSIPFVWWDVFDQGDYLIPNQSVMLDSPQHDWVWAEATDTDITFAMGDRGLPATVRYKIWGQ